MSVAELPTIVVCRGPHCRERGAMPLRQRLAALVRGRSDVQLVGYACFGQCERGPNVAFFPPGEWYGGLAATGDAERVLRHALGEQPLAQARLELPEDEREQHTRNVAELLTVLERDRSTGRRRWWWPF